MALKLENNLGTKFNLTHANNASEISLTSKDLTSTAYTVETIEELATVPVEFSTVIVKDSNRGGTFVSKTEVDIDPNTGNLYAVNGGTVFAKLGGGFWVRQYSGAVNVKWFGGNYAYPNGTIKIENSKLIGTSIVTDKIIGETSTTTDYGIHITNASLISDITIEHTCNATSTVNGRSNCAILLGAKLPSDDTKSKYSKIENVKIDYTDNNGYSGNTIGGFGDVSNIAIKNIDVVTNSKIGLQFHWGYTADSTMTNHPRSITVNDYTVIGDILNTTGLYLSGCHDIHISNGTISNCNQGIIIGAGDVGEGKNPKEVSNSKVMGNINISGYTLSNILNEAILINGASYTLNKDVLFPNQRWISANYPYTGISINNIRVLRDVNSSNNSIDLRHLANTNITNVKVAVVNEAQKTGTTEALSLTACIDSNIDITSNCVVSTNCLSGKNNNIKVNHTNSDIKNTTLQNGVVIRGSIVNATVRDAVNIGDTYIVLTLTTHIHKGMLFEYGNNMFTFDENANYSSRASENVGVKVKIQPATIAIPAGATIEQYYCLHNSTITGNIVGMNKGIRIISSDARVPYNINIDATFEKSITSDIEVPLGIVIKYNGRYYYNDNGGTMTFKNKVALQPTVISYEEINGKKIGSSAAVPTSKFWNKGDILYNRNAEASGYAGWVCTTAGTPGTWKTFGAITA